MKKDARLNVRIPYNLKAILDDICEQYKVSISGLILLLIEDGISKKDIKLPDKLKRKIKNYLIAKSRTEIVSKIYIKKNMCSRIMDLAMSDFFISGDINMAAIRVMVDLYVEEFETYDDDIKEIIGSDFKLIAKQLKNKEYLYAKVESHRTMKLIESKK